MLSRAFSGSFAGCGYSTELVIQRRPAASKHILMGLLISGFGRDKLDFESGREMKPRALGFRRKRLRFSDHVIEVDGFGLGGTLMKGARELRGKRKTNLARRMEGFRREEEILKIKWRVLNTPRTRDSVIQLFD